MSSSKAPSWPGPSLSPFLCLHQLGSRSSGFGLGCVSTVTFLIWATSIPHLDAAPAPRLASFLLDPLHTVTRIHVLRTKAAHRDCGRPLPAPDALRPDLLVSCALCFCSVSPLLTPHFPRSLCVQVLSPPMKTPIHPSVPSLNVCSSGSFFNTPGG